MKKFLAIEGIDGSDKSTQVEGLVNYLKRENISFKFIHFPRTNAPFFGELIARFLRGDFGKANAVDPYLVAMLYAGDREGMKNEIRKWQENQLVLVDRYVYSNIAFQCAKLKDKDEKEELREWIKKLEFEYFAIPKPDLSIFLDVPFGFAANNLTRSRTGNDREYLNGKTDIHEENLEFQNSVREEYLALLKSEKEFISVHCADKNANILSPDMILEEIIKICKKFNIF